MAPKFQKGPDLKRFMVRRLAASIGAEGEDMLPPDALAYTHTRTCIPPNPPLTLVPSFLSSVRAHQDKRLKVSLNGNRTLVGTLRGYDAFLNVVLEEVDSQEGQYLGQVVIRGNSIIQFEGLERVVAAA
jgi:small nuclear ribonucleoprotein G